MPWFFGARSTFETQIPPRVRSTPSKAPHPLCAGTSPSRFPLRRVPALRFRYDPSLVLGDETLSVLRSLVDQDET